MGNAYLKPGRETRVLGGHPWVFSSDIGRADEQCEPGGVVRVISAKGRCLGRALYNPRSQIALRMMTRRDEPVDCAFIRARVRQAIEYRRLFADLHSCRLIFSESDGLPGLIADAFADVIVVQCMALGMEPFLGDVADELCAQLQPVGVYERSDAPVRALEGLPERVGTLRGVVPDRVQMTENGIRFWVDVKTGQKTGYFLDQKENRAAIAPFVRGARVLDCFTHVGSFALHAARYGAREVIGVDISEVACASARENAALNDFDQVSFVCENAFDFLKRESTQSARYDAVILDPPAFTKTRGALDSATRGYKEINLRGMKLVRDGGTLVTCSCSQHVTPGIFMQILQSAALDAHVRLVQAEYRTQGRDHPILPAAPETQYLKCGIFRVLR